MAISRELDHAEFDAWAATRPQVIQDMIKSHPCDRLYMLNEKNRCEIQSYAEDRTVTISITGEYNLIMFPRSVFGVSIDDLVECDLPSKDEPVGEFCESKADVDAYLKCVSFGENMGKGKDVDSSDVPTDAQIARYGELQEMQQSATTS